MLSIRERCHDDMMNYYKEYKSIYKDDEKVNFKEYVQTEYEQDPCFISWLFCTDESIKFKHLEPEQKEEVKKWLKDFDIDINEVEEDLRHQEEQINYNRYDKLIIKRHHI